MKKERKEKSKGEKKEKYVTPKVLASYSKQELENAMEPHVSGGGCGCG